MKIEYIPKKFRREACSVIETANAIVAEYEDMGFTLTLRQLYYQFVARDLIENKESEYKRLGSVVNDARLAGLVDWSAIVDRTRVLRTNSHWQSPAEIVQSCSEQYRVDLWEHQPEYIEIWIEKDALIGVIESVCEELDVPYFSCRGYTSQSEAWEAGQRMRNAREMGKRVTVLHLGDHDPSGIDMSWDIWKRLNLFQGEGKWSNIKESYHQYEALRTQCFDAYGHSGVALERLALNMDQIKQFNPPPNPTKITDTRASPYLQAIGESSWEIDALDPRQLASIIRNRVMAAIEPNAWEFAQNRQRQARNDLANIARGLNTG